MKRTPILLVMAVAGLLLVAASTVAAQTATPAPATAPVSAPAPENGKQLYTDNCAPCHGASGQGDGPSASGLSVPPAALGKPEVAAARSLAEWFDITKNGRMQRMMPPWKDRLSDQQIWDSVAYAWGLHVTTDDIAAGKQVYEANCASCHGVDGKGAANGAPNLADFEKTSAISQATWSEAVANGKGAMPAFAGKLSADEQADALAYTRNLSMQGTLGRQSLTKGKGVISGAVINKTTGQPVADTTVLLGIFGETEMHEQRETKTDAAGAYRFTELPTDPTISYAARVEYPAGVPISSGFVTFEEGETTLELPVSVYETTEDPAGIRAERIHYIMEFDSGRALVAELVVLSQDGDRTYAGPGGITFTVPQGAQELSVNDEAFGGRFQQVDGGFVDLLPLPPGQGVRQVIYRYSLPYTNGTLDFTRSLPYPARAVNALISDVGQQVTSEQLQDQGKRNTENGAYFNLLGQDIAATQAVAIKLTGLPSGSGAGSGVTAASGGVGGGISRGLLFLIIGLAAGLAAFLVALPILRGRQRAGVATAFNGSREELVDALAQLDVAFENGEIDEPAYREQRLRLKAQLRDMAAKEARA